MSDTLDLPPYGPIPDDVRNRVRRSVQKRIRRPKHRTPVLVAAGVAILAAGAVVVTTGPSEPAEPARPLPTDVAMDRCWAAIQTTGKTAMYPDRAKWRPAVVAPPTYSPQTVVGIASDKEPFFCQTTDTSVTVSALATQPHYAEGSKTAAILMLDNLIAGVIDPSWPAALIKLDTESGGVFVPREGMFIYEAEVYRTEKPATVAKVARDYQVPNSEKVPGAGLPRPGAPAITIEDRPQPPRDRTSELGKALGDCLAKSGSQFVFDQDSYDPGATMAEDEARIFMARSATMAGSCATSPGSGLPYLYVFSYGPRLADVDKNKPVAFTTGGVNLNDGSRQSYGGLVPMKTARMVLRFENGAEVQPAVANGTFITIPPDGVVVDNGTVTRPAVTAKLFNSNGSMFYSGPVSFSEPPK